GAPSTPSPSGIFQIASMVKSPAWYQTGKVVPPGPLNPLGPRWMGLSLKGYGIHGTNSPNSVGGAKSHGCIRMRNGDVEELFELVRVGDVVELHAEALEQAIRY
ncbi:MAG TPA: L,D-transpeptidase, partial [Bryobacteraceae bacterium]|nr:L,D-transpeptidase [Bryobacteraceae bacterium]